MSAGPAGRLLLFLLVIMVLLQRVFWVWLLLLLWWWCWLLMVVMERLDTPMTAAVSPCLVHRRNRPIAAGAWFP